jgi:hypothetical protein
MMMESVSNKDFDTFVCILNTNLDDFHDHYNSLLTFCKEDDPKWVKVFLFSEKKEIAFRQYVRDTADIFVTKNMVCIVRYLLRNEYMSPNWLNCAGKKPMARLLIDFGAKPPPRTNLPVKYCKRAIRARQQLRQNAICILGAKHCRSRRIAGNPGFADVLQIIARCMWSARLNESFWFQ